MARKIRFHMGRVIKIGEMSADVVIAAIRQSTTVAIRGSKYTFTDARILGSESSPVGVYAKLSKYKPEGEVSIVDSHRHAVSVEPVPDLLEASSQFVYIPESSGIAYQHVWNVIQKERFERAFCDLINSSEATLLGRVEIDSVSDLRTFAAKLSRIDTIQVLSATVHPPNPLFGPCWKSLSEYLIKRDLAKLEVREESESGLKTNLPKLATLAINVGSDGSIAAELIKASEPLLDGVGDAAILMAADGYGRAKVKGLESGQVVTVRTDDNQKNFTVAANIAPIDLYQEARKIFQAINDDRYLQH